MLSAVHFLAVFLLVQGMDFPESAFKRPRKRSVLISSKLKIQRGTSERCLAYGHGTRGRWRVMRSLAGARNFRFLKKSVPIVMGLMLAGVSPLAHLFRVPITMSSAATAANTSQHHLFFSVTSPLIV